MKADIGLINTILFGWTLLVCPFWVEINFDDSFGHIACIVYTGILGNVSPIIISNDGSLFLVIGFYDKVGIVRSGS